MKTEGREGKGTSTPPPAGEDPTIGFDEFWNTYPLRNGKRIGKAKTLALWKPIFLADKRLAYKAARNYATAVAQGLTIAKDPERFLRGDYWREWLEPAAADPDRSSKAARNEQTSRTLIDQLRNGSPRPDVIDVKEITG